MTTTTTIGASARIPYAQYAAILAVNWSALKEMRRSPLHYAHILKQPREDSTTLAKGRAIHTAVLEPDRFPIEYAVFEGKARRGKAWAAFRDVNDTKTILTLEEYTRALAIRDAVRAHPPAARYLRSARRELSLAWVDAVTGLPCKARLDVLSEVDGRIFVVDLKSTHDLDMRRFGSIAARLGYHSQLAWYARGMKACGIPCDGARIIAVEQDAPHDVGVFVVDDDLLYAGDEEVRELLMRARVCLEKSAWPGRYEREEPLEMPRWFYADDEAEIGNVTYHGA